MKYIGLTIGPIYKTLSKAKKPKELWLASYTFSYVMRKIIENFKERNFITPFIGDKKVFEEKGLGLFHDRFIFESEEGDLEELEKVIDKVLDDLATNLHINSKDLKEYFQIHYLELEVDKNKNPIMELSPYLDSKELFFQTSQNSDEVLKKIIDKENNFLLKDKKIKDSIGDLSSKDYFAVVHADGDNMSKVIKGKNDEYDKDNIEKVSKNLFDYAIESDKKIKSFGGQTIFAGGDDLLFFAPITAENKKTIFNLCDEISKIFDEKIGGEASLSFGVSIQYKKFPLYEALEESRGLLFGKAKKEPKNSIAFRVRKNSGQTFESIIYKGKDSIYKTFLKFISILEDSSQLGVFLDSIHHKIDTYKFVINQIAKDKKKLNNFFDNYFNEDVHKNYREFFNSLVIYMNSIYKDETIKDEDKLNLVYSTLRFIKFIKGDKN